MKKVFTLPKHRQLIITFLLFASYTAGAQTPFQRVYNTLNTKCQNASCHSATSPNALKFDGNQNATYAAIFNVTPANASSIAKNEKLVKQQHPYYSFLLRKIAGSDFDTDLAIDTATEGILMKDINGNTLTKKEIEFMRQWIMFGAKQSYSASEPQPNWQLVNDFYDSLAVTGVNLFLSKPLKPAPGTGIQVRMGPIFLPVTGEIEQEYLEQQELNFPYIPEVYRIDGFMSNQSHHLFLFKFQDTLAAINGNAADATNMAKVGLLTTSFDGDKDISGVWLNDRSFDMPPGTGMFWDKKTYLDLDFHVKNYNATTVIPCDFYCNVYYRPRNPGTVQMKTSLSEQTLTLILPGNATTTLDFNDPLNNANPAEWRYLWNIGSMTHKFGTDFDIYIRDTTGQLGSQIYEGFWDYDNNLSTGYYNWQHPPLRTMDTLLPVNFGKHGSLKSGLLARTTWNVTQASTVFFDPTLEGEEQLWYYMYTSQPLLFEVGLGANQTVCSGTPVTLNSSISGGTSPYTYLWSSTGNSLSCNNCTNPTATITQNSTYHVTVTDANNITASANVSYSPGSGILQITSNSSTTFCVGGSVILNAGSGYTSYLWNNGATTSTISVTTSGTYSVTAINSTGCSFTGSQLVTVNSPTPQPIIGNPSVTSFQTYSYSVNATSGTTYNWTTTGGAIQSGQGTNIVNVIWGNTGPYLVTLIQTHTTGCSDTAVLVVVNSGCTLGVNVLTAASSPLCSGDSAILIAQVDSSATYQWIRNGSPISAQNDDTLVVVVSGTYQVQVTSGSCTVMSNSSLFNFQSTPSIPVISSNAGNNTCNPQSVTLKVNNTYTGYMWNTGNTTDSINVTLSGGYTITVTGSNGCKSASQPYNLNLSIVAPNQICLVSVDSATGKNLIIWEKPNITGVDSYFVYKETSQFNVFNKTGALGVHDFSAFIDINSNPQQQADRYKLAVLDTCGNINLQSNAHKTIHLTINSGLGNVWNLIWNHYEGFAFPSYNIYRGTAGNALQLLTSISSGNNSYTDVSPPANLLFYQIEAVNPNGCIPTAKTENFSSSRSNVVQIQGSGINDLPRDLEVFIYPNPAMNQLFITTNGIAITEINIYNTTGNLLAKVKQPQSKSIDISQLPEGVYIAEIKTKDASVTKRWIKM